MIKAKIGGAEGELTTLLFGLTAKNVHRMMNGDAVRFDLAEMGLPGHQVIIVYGQTEQAMFDEFQKAGMISDQTVIHDDTSKDR